MRVCGVICEYNPFHNGHAFHLRRLREETGCDGVVCVMSGCFTQRGEAAVVSKWARAEMALRGGADAVFELPALYAVRDAERFARGGVALLDALGVVTDLAFGSETGDVDGLAALAEAGEDLAAIRRGLDQGMTLARARGEAARRNAAGPNDTLGVEYLRALRDLPSGMRPVAIRREGGGYHDGTLSAMASATAIRAALRRGESVYGAMPGAAYALLARLLDAGAISGEHGLDTVLLARLRTMTPQALSRIADVGEGLENRLLRAAREATDRASLLAAVKCKRYTWSRLSRVLTQALLGMTRQLAVENPLPPYARLLGFRRNAQGLIGDIQRRASVPVITRAAKYRAQGDPVFELDLRATDLWTLGLTNPGCRGGGQDLTRGVVIIE